MSAYALWLGLLLLGALLVGVYVLAWWQRAPRVTAFLLLSTLGIPIALGLGLAVSRAAGELRPYITHPHVLVLVGRAKDYAFPSDHATVAGALVASVLFAIAHLQAHQTRPPSPTEPAARPGHPELGAIVVAVLLLSLLLCFSRVYVGAHYPGDVVAGLLLGAVVVAILSPLKPLSDLVADRLTATAAGTLLRRPSARRQVRRRPTQARPGDSDSLPRQGRR